MDEDMTFTPDWEDRELIVPEDTHEDLKKEASFPEEQKKAWDEGHPAQAAGRGMSKAKQNSLYGAIGFAGPGVERYYGSSRLESLIEEGLEDDEEKPLSYWLGPDAWKSVERKGLYGTAEPERGSLYASTFPEPFDNEGDPPGEPAEVLECPACGSAVSPSDEERIERGEDTYCSINCLNEAINE